MGASFEALNHESSESSRNSGASGFKNSNQSYGVCGPHLPSPRGSPHSSSSMVQTLSYSRWLAMLPLGCAPKMKTRQRRLYRTPSIGLMNLMVRCLSDPQGISNSYANTMVSMFDHLASHQGTWFCNVFKPKREEPSFHPCGKDPTLWPRYCD